MDDFNIAHEADDPEGFGGRNIDSTRKEGLALFASHFNNNNNDKNGIGNDLRKLKITDSDDDDDDNSHRAISESSDEEDEAENESSEAEELESEEESQNGEDDDSDDSDNEGDDDNEEDEEEEEIGGDWEFNDTDTDTDNESNLVLDRTSTEEVVRSSSDRPVWRINKTETLRDAAGAMVKSTKKKPPMSHEIMLLTALIENYVKTHNATQFLADSQKTKLFDTMISQLSNSPHSLSIVTRSNYLEYLDSLLLNNINMVQDRRTSEAMIINPEGSLGATLLHTSRKQARYAQDFDEIEFIAKGGFGSVHKCRHRLDQQIYCVKKIVIPKHISKLIGSKDIDIKEIEAKLYAELRTMAQSEHENIARYYNGWLETGWIVDDEDDEDDVDDDNEDNDVEEAEEDDGDYDDDDNANDFDFDDKNDYSEGSDYNSKAIVKREPQFRFILYIQMAYYPMDLEQFIEAHSFDPIRSVQLLLKITKAISYLHNRGIVHRDINPRNIFLSIEESAVGSTGGVQIGTDLHPCWITPRIGDFGLVLNLKMKWKRDNYGTLLYQPPEDEDSYDEHGNFSDSVGRIQRPCAKTDCYALGVVLFELLYRMKTLSERHNTLSQLKGKRAIVTVDDCVKLPEDFPTNSVGNDEQLKKCLNRMLHPSRTFRWTIAEAKQGLENCLL